MKKNPSNNRMIEPIGMVLIGLVSLGYVLFGKMFAECHIYFNFFDFPVFVGELLLFSCLILFIWKYRFCIANIKSKHYFLLLYFGFILAKALKGYLRWGPLAFRHAALFYYFLFAVFGYAFYRQDFFSHKKNALFALILICILGFLPFYKYFLLTCFILALVLIQKIPHKTMRYLLLIFLLITTPYRLFFQTTRTMLVSNIATAMFTGFGIFFTLKIRKTYKVILLLLFTLCVGTVVLKMADRDAVLSLVDVRNLIRLYEQYNKVIVEREDNFEMVEIREVKLYNPEPELEKKWQKIAKLTQAKEVDERSSFLIQGEKPSGKIQGEKPSGKIQGEKPSGNLEGAQVNSLFRIFIWRDMLAELLSDKPIFGYSFGKPLRSKSLEIYNWAYTEWTRDGWISSHNSYLNIIYRSGIIGIVFICTLVVFLFKMIKTAGCG